MKNLKHLIALSSLAWLNIVADSPALGQSSVYVFGPETFVRKGSAQATVYARTFNATPGGGVVDMDDLGTLGADGSVSLNGVTLMDVRAITGEVGPRHKSATVTLHSSNTLVVSLVGKNKSQLRVSVAQPTGYSCYPDLDAPQLSLGTIVTQNGYDFYYLLVPNNDSFPEELFWAAPGFSSCGSIITASRTLVEVRSGFQILSMLCHLASPADLNTISFAVPAGTAPPSQVYIRLWDRYCDTDYTSATLSLP